MIVVREITEEDWELFRDTRLGALAEAPRAFASTYAQEAAFTERQWRSWIGGRSATFLAYQVPPGPEAVRPVVGGPVVSGPVVSETVPAGLAAVYGEGIAAHLVSMWVRPAARGLGVGEALVEAAASWAHTRDFTSLILWVTESNGPARRLYERCGFVPTGERQPLPSDPTLPEIKMSRTI
jgi:GNAT superfamily N-acetyltransferase